MNYCVVRHTQTTRGNISGNQNGGFATPKFCGTKSNTLLQKNKMKLKKRMEIIIIM